MLGDEIDKKVQLYIQQLIQRGDVILRSIAVSVATDLLEWDEFFGKIKITETWAKSLLKLMGFVRRAKTSWTVETPEDASKEIEYQYLYQIVNAIEKWDIYPDLVVNFDQAPSKLAPVGRFTLAKRNSTNVTIAGSSNKKTYSNVCYFFVREFSTSSVDILWQDNSKFLLSVNPTHDNNSQESIKFIEEILELYFTKKRRDFGLTVDQKGLLIFDVFTRQMTSDVK